MTPAHRLLRISTLALLVQACATESASGVWVSGRFLQQELGRWEQKLPPEKREAVRRLRTDSTALVHVREGEVTGRAHRGSASRVGSASDLECSTHPPSEGIDPNRNWDIIYDRAQQKRMEQRTNLPSPVESLLHHELLGHVVPALAHPEMIEIQRRGDERAKNELENHAIAEENEYRKLVRLPPVPSLPTPGEGRK